MPTMPLPSVEVAQGFATPCWIYQGGSFSNGYGVVNVARDSGRGSTNAHRLAYEEVNGPVPPGYDVHHKCLVRACIRPDHLEAVPRAEHAHLHERDGGKRPFVSRSAASHPTAGIAHEHGENVAVDDAMAALERAGGLVTPRELAAEWGVSEQAIAGRIARGNFPEPIKTAGRVRLYLRDQVEPYRGAANVTDTRQRMTRAIAKAGNRKT
jgi:hypothetical protein